MNRIRILVLTIVVAILGAVLYKPLTVGVEILGLNRKVKSVGWDKCNKIAGPTFCEDALIDPARGLAILACDHNRRRYNTVLQTVVVDETLTDGEIWMYELDSSKLIKLAIADYAGSFHPLGITTDSFNPSSQPNLTNLFVINLGTEGPNILLLTLDLSQNTPVLTHKRTISSPAILTPNSIITVPYLRHDDGTPSFFVTNDHFFVKGPGKFLEDWLLLPLSNLVFYNARKDEARIVRRGFRFANGIGRWGKDAAGLFVAETLDAAMDAFKIANIEKLTDASSGETAWPELELVATLHLGYSVDNIHVDEASGDVTIAGHLETLRFLKFAKAPLPNVGSAEHPVGYKRPGSRVDRISVNQTLEGFEMKVEETLFQDNGERFTTSSVGAIDNTRKRMIVTGLYEYGFLDCQI